MTEIRQLDAHDPLPDGPSLVVMRRFEEELPDAVMIEMIVTRADGSELTQRMMHEDGSPMTFDEATRAAQSRAEREGLDHIWRVDRLEGTREQAILQRHGDHSAGTDRLDDDDLEDGEHGADMRDVLDEGAPRRF